MAPTQKETAVVDSLDRMEIALLSKERLEHEIPEPNKNNLKSEFIIHGKISQELARHLYGSDHFSSIRTQLMLNGSHKISKQFQYVISGRFYYDAVYDLGYYPKNVVSDQRSEFELRDTYFDYSSGPLDMRLGKQQIVWGEAVGSFVTDIVNARDYRNNVLDEFDQIRIPEWGMNIEYTLNDLHTEFLYIPIPEFDKFGVENAPFAIPSGLPTDVPVNRQDPSKPSNLKSAKVGTRFSYLINGFDISLLYLNSWTHSPVEYRTINGSGGFDFSPQYKRLQSFGGTVSKELNQTVLRGELIYNKDNYFSTTDLSDPNGISISDDINYVLGVDHTFWDNTAIALQFQQHIIMDYSHVMADRHFSNISTFRIERPFWNHSLDTEFQLSASLNSPDFLYQPSIKYNISDNWQTKLGLDIFAGDPTNMLGFYKPQSRYYGSVTHKF